MLTVMTLKKKFLALCGMTLQMSEIITIEKENLNRSFCFIVDMKY